MTWTPPPRSSTARAIYEAAEDDRKRHPQRYTLDIDAVVARACEKAECPATEFAAGWREGLERFLSSAAHEARLNAVGTRMASQTAIGRLVAGARIGQALKQHPSLAAAPVPPPIIIAGGWRTGTTFLFRLLGSDPRLHAPLPAELVAPWRHVESSVPSPEAVTGGATNMLHTLNPEMAIVHPSGPTLPEECVLGMGADLRNWGLTSMMRLGAYAEWLGEQDFAGPYMLYRKVLQLLQANDPRRFVLKAPAHTAELQHVAAVFPGATVVQIHRDIVTTITSGTSLFAVYQATYSDEVDPVDVGHRQMDQSELWFRRAHAFRTSPQRANVTLVDLDYGEFIAHPVAALNTIYAAAGLEPPPDPARFVEDFNTKHPRDPQKVHRYAPEDFGLDDATIRDRFAFLDGRG